MSISIKRWLLLFIFVSLAGTYLIAPNSTFAQDANTSAGSIFGTIQAPPGVANYSSGETNGLIVFLSNIIRLVAVVAGIFTMFNFVLAGFQYVSAQGDSSTHGKVKERLTMSVIGLIIIVGAYTIAGVVGLVIFGDAGFILSPTLYGPGGR